MSFVNKKKKSAMPTAVNWIFMQYVWRVLFNAFMTKSGLNRYASHIIWIQFITPENMPIFWDNKILFLLVKRNVGIFNRSVLIPQASPMGNAM